MWVPPSSCSENLSDLESRDILVPSALVQYVQYSALGCRQACWMRLSFLAGSTGLKQSRICGLITVLCSRLLEIRAETEIINSFQAVVHMLPLTMSGVVLQV